MRIFFSAGEPSGDQHVAHLLEEFRQRRSDFSAEGFGGPAMREQGCRLLHDTSSLAVMGFLRVVPLLAQFRRLVHQAEEHFRSDRPDAVVLVDFPGFNWWIARAASRLNIPVYYFLPPQLWGWAPWRIRRVHRWVDHVICTLPFEYKWYTDRGVMATWVGHPFFDAVAEHNLDTAVLSALRGTRSPGPVFAILPGSRDHEVERNWPVMLQVAAEVQRKLPAVRWIVGCYCEQHRIRCKELNASQASDVSLLYECGNTPEVIEAADACLMVSGSISLELLARRTPGVVLYRTSRIERLGVRALMNCRYITLPNLIADDELMPEFISTGPPGSDVDRMSDILVSWGTQPEQLEQRCRWMAELAENCAVTGAIRRTADLLTRLLEHDSRQARAA